jgi:hypothetical protein
MPLNHIIIHDTQRRCHGSGARRAEPPGRNEIFLPSSAFSKYAQQAKGAGRLARKTAQRLFDLDAAAQKTQKKFATR